MSDRTENRKHALLGASSAYRWMHCTPSAVAESKVTDEGSAFAREGTLAHAIGAKMLKERLGRDTAAEEREIAELRDEYFCGEMQEYCAGYVNFVLERYAEAEERAKRAGEIAPMIVIEGRLDFSDWVPDGFGTGDAIIIGGGMLEIIDLKYGKGVSVSAERNPQMMLYALGATSGYDYIYDIDRVRMTIYQPRTANISEYELHHGALLAWATETVRPLAGVAYRGLGARESGSWCRFCKVKGSCAELARQSLGMHGLSPDAAEIATEDLPGILDRLDIVRDWIKAVEERSLRLALDGEDIPGYKIVEGRSIRKITDPDSVASALAEAGWPETAIFRPRELRTLTDLEKAVGKKTFARMCGEWIEKPQGKPTLVADSDRREAMTVKGMLSGLDLGD